LGYYRNLPEYSSNYDFSEYKSKNMSLSLCFASSDEHRNSLMGTEPFQIDTTPF
ncbi:8216_t:CDS:2, partial [Gigaspora margarita]